MDKQSYNFKIKKSYFILGIVLIAMFIASSIFFACGPITIVNPVDDMDGFYVLTDDFDYDIRYVIVNDNSITINHAGVRFIRAFSESECGLFYNTNFEDRYIRLSFRKIGDYIQIDSWGLIWGHSTFPYASFILRRNTSIVFNDEPLVDSARKATNFTLGQHFAQWDFEYSFSLLDTRVEIKRPNSSFEPIEICSIGNNLRHINADYGVGLNTLRVTTIGGAVLYNNEIRIIQDEVAYFDININGFRESRALKASNVHFKNYNNPMDRFDLKFYSGPFPRIYSYIPNMLQLSPWLLFACSLMSFNSFDIEGYAQTGVKRVVRRIPWRLSYGQNSFKIVAMGFEGFDEEGYMNTPLSSEPFYFTLYRHQDGTVEVI